MTDKEKDNMGVESNEIPISIDFSASSLTMQQLNGKQRELSDGQRRLESGEEDYTGWVRLPKDFDRQEVQRIKEAAETIRSKCNAFVVIGIGGSYLGARAAIEMLA